MCGEKYEKSGKTPLFGVRTHTEVTGFNGEVTATAVKWDQVIAKVTGGAYCVTPIYEARSFGE